MGGGGGGGEGGGCGWTKVEPVTTRSPGLGANRNEIMENYDEASDTALPCPSAP